MGMWLGIISYQILWKEPILEAHSTGIKVEEIYMSTTFWTWSRKLETGNMKRELRNGRRILHDDNWELIERVYLHLGPPDCCPPPWLHFGTLGTCISGYRADWYHSWVYISLFCFVYFSLTILNGLTFWLSRKYI